MSEFLSDEWFESMAAAAAATSTPVDLHLTLEQTIVDVAAWTIRIHDGQVEFVRGGSADADVRIVTDASTADGIRAGTLSAQRAFLDGELRIGGDVAALINHRETLAGLGVSFG